jgi:hypothetical protein
MESVNVRTGTHLQRIALGIFCAAVGLYCDNAAPQQQRPLIQAILWSFTVFALLVVELRRTLLRKRQVYIGLVLVTAHFYFLSFQWKRLPFESSFSILLLALLESILIGLIYIRLGQSLDPEGPFGLTEEEKARREEIPKIT